MLKLLTTARRFATTTRDAVRSVTNPAALVEAKATEQPAPVAAAEPAGLYGPDDMPPVEDIERAALGYDLAAESARSADRAKRKHKAVLGKLPSGIYGRYRIFRTPSSRSTPDLAEITRIFKAHGLGAVPMKPCAASLKVELVATAHVDIAELVAA